MFINIKPTNAYSLTVFKISSLRLKTSPKYEIISFPQNYFFQATPINVNRTKYPCIHQLNTRLIKIFELLKIKHMATILYGKFILPIFKEECNYYFMLNLLLLQCYKFVWFIVLHLLARHSVSKWHRYQVAESVCTVEPVDFCVVYGFWINNKIDVFRTRLPNKYQIRKISNSWIYFYYIYAW